MVYVLCAGHREFLAFCDEHGVNPKQNGDFRYLGPNNMDAIRGVSRGLILVWGDLRGRVPYCFIEEVRYYARVHYMPWVEVPEPRRDAAMERIKHRGR